MTVCFYTTARAETGESGKSGETGDSKASDKKVVERAFYFGEAGKYYEYIIFFDRVEELAPGQYRYAIFFNRRLIYEDRVVVSPPETK